MQKKRNLFFHTGTHKTGTTAIQRFLKANRKIFERKGFGIAGLNTSERAQIKQIAKTIGTNQKNNKATTQYDPITDSIARCQNKSDKKLHSFIISWEGFSGNNRNGYLDAGHYAKFIAQYNQKFRVKSITFFRRQDDFIESMYTQNVKHGYPESFDYYLENIEIGWFSWLSMAKNYEEELGRDNVIIARYGKEYFQDETSILKQFVEHLGLIPDEFDLAATNKPFAISNPGWPRHVVEVTRELNSKIPQHQRPQYIRAINSLMHKKSNKDYTYLEEAHRKALALRFHNSNLILARERFGEQSLELFKGEVDLIKKQIKPLQQNDDYNLDRDALLDLILEMALNLEGDNNILKSAHNIQNRQIKSIEPMLKLIKIILRPFKTL